MKDLTKIFPFVDGKALRLKYLQGQTKGSKIQRLVEVEEARQEVVRDFKEIMIPRSKENRTVGMWNFSKTQIL